MSKKKKTEIKPFKAIKPTSEQITAGKEDVSKFLRECRLNLGLTTEKVCQDLEISKSTLSKDELGRGNMSISRFVYYLKYYNVELF